MAKEWVMIFVVVMIVFQLFIGVSRVDGTSMEPTLKDGQLVFFCRISQNYENGDVVLARMPSGEYYVKRIIATEGEVVDLKDGILYVNGVPESGAYVQGRTEAQEGIVTYPYIVEEGTCFVAGDNREASMDSRSFGALPENSMKGKLFVY